ncbi:MAG: T9SS type A sorting domain-containing protein [Crocinitomicaceae bacterium]
MKRSLLIASTFLSAMTFAQDCTELFISEYIEGVGNNKALEIYNPTANSIDLTQYIVIRFSNGSTTATSNYAVQLTGSIAAYSTHVGVVDLRDPNGSGQTAPIWDDLEVKGDAFYSPDYNTNSTWYWNGDDAVVLAKGTAVSPMTAQVVDIFGKIGEDPGTAWTTVAPYTEAAGGPFVTSNHSLIRKASILKGVTNPAITSFNALAEYDSIPALINVGGNDVGNWESLGVHACNCSSAAISEISKANILIYPNPSNGTFIVKGLEEISQIEVVNSLGQTIQKIKTKSNSIVKIDLSNRKGVYFVKLSDELGDLITRKVIIN